MTREEQLACLKDRPCDVCKMRTDKGCSSWECVFEQTPEEEKGPCEDCISFPKGTLKKRGKGYVAYNYAWLKKNWQTELKAMGIECEDCISREEVCDYIAEFVNHEYATDREREMVKHIIGGIQHLPSVRPKPKTGWIPVSERLPEDLEPVNITWVNHNPESYYADIKNKPFTATGHYCNGKWWWYSVTCQDYLYEYGRCDVDVIDDDIEVIAWMPLPEPYKAESEDKE